MSVGIRVRVSHAAGWTSPDHWGFSVRHEGRGTESVKHNYALFSSQQFWAFFSFDTHILYVLIFTELRQKHNYNCTPPPNLSYTRVSITRQNLQLPPKCRVHIKHSHDWDTQTYKALTGMDTHTHTHTHKRLDRPGEYVIQAAGIAK